MSSERGTQVPGFASKSLYHLSHGHRPHLSFPHKWLRIKPPRRQILLLPTSPGWPLCSRIVKSTGRLGGQINCGNYLKPRPSSSTEPSEERPFVRGACGVGGRAGSLPAREVCWWWELVKTHDRNVIVKKKKERKTFFYIGLRAFNPRASSFPHSCPK